MTTPILAYYVHPKDRAIWDAYEVVYDTQNRVFFAENRAPLPYFVGNFEFDRFEAADQPSLRAADAFAQAQRNNAALDRLQRPIKPEKRSAETRLRVVSLPGENNLQAMQRTFAEAEAPYRADRERQRRQVMNQPPSEQQQALNRAAANANAAYFAQQARRKSGA